MRSKESGRTNSNLCKHVTSKKKKWRGKGTETIYRLVKLGIWGVKLIGFIVLIVSAHCPSPFPYLSLNPFLFCVSLSDYLMVSCYSHVFCLLHTLGRLKQHWIYSLQKNKGAILNVQFIKLFGKTMTGLYVTHVHPLNKLLAPENCNIMMRLGWAICFLLSH